MTTSTVSASSDSAGATKKLLPKIMTEYLNDNPLAKFMRTDSEAVIQIDPAVAQTSIVGGGLQFLSTFRPRLSKTGVKGEGKSIEGTEEDLGIYTDTLTASRVAKGVKVQNFVESQRRTVANLKSETKMALKEWLTTDLYDSIITALKDTTGRTKARTLYGSSDDNYNATEATARATVDTTNDRMSTKIINLLVTKANQQGQAKIRPANVSQKKGVKVHGFQLIMPSAAYDDLEDDAKWREKHKYIAREEGRIAHSGCQYKGTYNGVDVHVIYDENLYAEGEGAASADLGICFLLGAQAVKVGYPQTAKIEKSNSNDYNTQHKEAIVEWRGQKKNVFRGEDFSVITAYVACDAPAAV